MTMPLMQQVTQATLESKACTIARLFHLREALVYGVIERESSWKTNLEPRFEQGFYERYEKAEIVIDKEEAYKRSCSWGLMQIMGETARELGYDESHDLALLADPEIGIQYGCKFLARLMELTNGNEAEALLHYNGGGNPNYPNEVLALAKKYEPIPVGSVSDPELGM